MKDSAGEFWIWFKEHNKSYLLIDETDEDLKEQLLNDLLAHLHEYCEHLYFQVGGKAGEEQELIITAEGDSDFFEQVETLVNSAPLIADWTFTAFVQPHDDLTVTNFEDVELKPAEMWFLPLESASSPNSIGMRVCTPNYDVVKDSKWFSSAIYQVLDVLLGEKSFALDIEHVEFGKVPENPEEQNMIELAELRRYVNWKKSKRSSS